MVSLGETLENLGLSQYLKVLTENGFDDWETVLDITEDDLHDLGFKLGHRRILQREIANFRNSSTPDTCRSPTSAHTPGALSPTAEATASTLETAPADKRTKRRYRWHPRPDPNAPKRPKTAYVNFADHLRTDPAIANLSFVEIAREVGRQWQLMDPGLKQKWETQAAAAMQEHEEQMEVYRRTDAYQEYQQYLESFKKAPGKTTRQKLRTNSSSQMVPTRSRRSESVESGESGRTQSMGPSGESAERLQEECQQALFRAMAELKRLRQEYGDFEPQDTTSMPPDDLARTAIGAMLDGCDSLLYVFSREQAEELVRSAYDPSSNPNALLLTELCILSAVGGHFDSRTIPSALTKRLVATALTFLDSVIVNDESYLRIMRVLCCFAVYSLLEKHLSAKYCVAAALAIARWKYPQLGRSGNSSVSRESWRKVYRTIVFLECWMCYTLGYPLENIRFHLKYTLRAAIPQDFAENAIQHQAAKLVVIAAEVSHAVQQSEQITAASMDYLIRKLDGWQHELPAPLQLISLISSGNGTLSAPEERAMLMVHILYLGAVILLYRQLLVAADTDRQTGQWTLAITERDVARYQAGCEMAAQQVARVLDVVKLEGHCTLRCWLLTYWSFSASVVLLYRAAQNLRDGKLLSVDEQLTFSKTCIQMLRVCGNEEPIAVRYLAMLVPAFDTLQGIRQKLDAEVERGKRSSQPKISISALLESPSPTPSSTPQEPRSISPQPPEVDPMLKEEASKIIARVGVLLNDPFGRFQQSGESGSAEIPYPSPALSETIFWFR